jgi:hypothetical protein
MHQQFHSRIPFNNQQTTNNKQQSTNNNQQSINNNQQTTINKQRSIVNSQQSRSQRRVHVFMLLVWISSSWFSILSSMFNIQDPISNAPPFHHFIISSFHQFVILPSIRHYSLSFLWKNDHDDRCSMFRMMQWLWRLWWFSSNKNKINEIKTWSHNNTEHIIHNPKHSIIFIDVKNT